MWGALAAGAAAGLASSALGVFGQHESARLQKEFYKKRHQYEVADLRKAGLNPVLSATNGASGGLNVPGIDGSGAVNSAIQSYRAVRENDLLDAQVATEYWKQQLLSQQTTSEDIKNTIGFDTVDSEIARVNSANKLATMQNLYDSSPRGMGYFGGKRAYEAYGPTSTFHSFADSVEDAFSSAKSRLQNFFSGGK